MGVEELMANVVSGIVIAPPGAGLALADVLAGVAVWGAAVAVFRFSREARTKTARTTRATTLHRIIVQSSWISVAALNHISGKRIPSPAAAMVIRSGGLKSFLLLMNKVRRSKMMRMFYKF